MQDFKRNAPLIHDGIDPPQQPDAVVRERVAVGIYRVDVMTMSELSLVVDSWVCMLSRPDPRGGTAPRRHPIQRMRCESVRDQTATTSESMPHTLAAV